MIRDYPFYFNENRDNPESELLESIYDEAIALHSYLVYYIKREFFGEIVGFGEFMTKYMEKAIPIRAFVENIEGFDGPGNMFTKFGLMKSEEINLIVSKKEFERCSIVPKPQDLILIPTMKDKLFEITHVDDDDRTGSFYTLGKCFGYRIYAKLMKFDYSEICDDISQCKNLDCLTKHTSPKQMREDIDKIEHLLDLEISETDTIINALVDENDAPESANEILDNSEKNKLGLLD